MKRFIVLFILCTMPGLTSTATMSATNVYWLVFQTSRYFGDGIQRIYLMQIDGHGNVTKQPQEILSSLRRSRFFAIARIDRDEISFWTCNFRNRFHYAVIDKRTYATKTIEKLDAGFEASRISLTHRAGHNFMLMSTDYFLLGAGITPSGKLTGRYWPLSPPDDARSGIISDDGLALLLSPCIFQSLDERGIPDRKSIQVARSHHSCDEYCTDITNRLADGTRRIAEWKVCYDGSMSLRIRSVHAKKGFSVAPLVSIFSNEYQEYSLSLLDPEGNFLIYQSTEFRKASLTLNYVLLFQALDTTAHASGAPKPLVENVVEFDFLKDSSP